MNLNGKTALITGASRGIGKAIAIRFATLGAKVSIVSRNVKALEKTASEIKNLGGNVIYIPGDISKKEEVHSILDRTIFWYNLYTNQCSSKSTTNWPILAERT
jgi:3-oxoacyl-[acyl-carrier protein] reductase